VARGNSSFPRGRRIATYVVVVSFVALAVFMENQRNPVVGIVGALLGAVVLVFGIRPTIDAVAAVVEFVAGRPVLKWLVIGVAGAVAVALAVPPTLAILAGGAHGPQPFAGSCPQPTELRVLTSPESLAPARELLGRYASATADPTRHCPPVHPFVYAATTPAVAKALATGWVTGGEANPLDDIGPRPDVWLPDSTVDVGAVDENVRAAALPSPIRQADSIGSSRMVVARLGPLPAPPGTGPEWSALVSQLLGSRAGLLASDPQASATGLLAMASYLRDGPHAVSLTQARLREQAISRSGGLTAEDSLDLLCRYDLDSATDPPAIITSDQLWQWFTHKQPLGDACARTDLRTERASVLRPADTAILDHPFVAFTWTGGAQLSAVTALYNWLVSAAGADVLSTHLYLGPARRECSESRRSPGSVDPCVPVDLGELKDLYGRARMPGRVLFALDASGSMGDRVDSGGATRFTVAVGAIGQALGQIGPADEFGMWIFSGARTGQTELVPIGAGDQVHRQQVVDRLAGAHPSGGTPLYATILTGLAKVAAGGSRDGPRALIVLTDGQDTTSGLTATLAAQQVADANRSSGAQLYVIATGEASCDDASALRALTRTGQGRCLNAAPSQLAGAVAELFDSLWRGQ
jgi:hypothetical protein